jgi:mono/diheme cytochrome c family protein
MWRTNLTIMVIVLGTLTVYTTVANIIPQVESDVPTEVSLSADVSPEELVAVGEQVFEGAGGCTACHGLGTRAPDLLGVAGTVCETRKPGMSCKEYLYESLTEPGVYVVEGFQPIMPDLRRTLSEQQVWATVAFLQSQGGQVTVTADDFAESLGGQEPASGAVAPTGGGATAVTGDPADPKALLRSAGCFACHVLDGEGGPVGPPFDGIGAERDADHIRRSILYPNADTAQGYEAFAGTMPLNFGEQFTAAQLEALVRFLAESR